MYAKLHITVVEEDHKLDNYMKMLLTAYWITVKYSTKTGVISMFSKEKKTLQINLFI